MNQMFLTLSLPSLFPFRLLSLSPFYIPSSLSLFPFSLSLFYSPLFSYPLELLPPIISGESTVNESGSLLLDCNVFNSYPIPSVAWFGPQGGGPLTTKRELIIPNITRSMAGQYHCAAFHEDGTENSYVTVIVQCELRGLEGGRKRANLSV